MDLLDDVTEQERIQAHEPPMPPEVFVRAGDARHPVLTRVATAAAVPYFGNKPAIRLSRMAVARDTIAQLGLTIYSEGLYRPESGRMSVWLRYNLPARANPYGFRIRKTYGRTCRAEAQAWESLGERLIQEITLETGYNVDDVNYRFCAVVCSQFTELHRIAAGATLMAHCAQEGRRDATLKLDELMSRLKSILVEYDDVLPFSKVKEKEDAEDAGLALGRMEGLARELVNLARGDETGLDDID